MKLPLSSLEGVSPWLAFQVDASQYALPIDSIVEIGESNQAACVPGLSRDCAAVINWHGDVLPIVSCRRLMAEDQSPESVEVPSHGGVDPRWNLGPVLVISGQGSDFSQLGLSVDHVIGLLDPPGGSERERSILISESESPWHQITPLSLDGLLIKATEIVDRAVDEFVD